MKKMCCMLVVVLALICMNGIMGCNESLAAPSVKMTINPSETNISAGDDPIALTARASGSGLKFEWKLLGPGRLDGPATDTAIFYVPPATVAGGSGRAIVSVRVTDKHGEDTTESVIFNIKGSAGQSGRAAQESTKQGATVQQVDKEGFSFALQQCKKSGSNVACHLLITNGSQDKELNLYRDSSDRRTRIIDEFGNEYVASFIQLGNRSTDSYRVENLLVVGVPTKTLLKFEGVNAEAQTIALLEIGCHASGNYFRTQLRKVPISR